MGVEEGGYQPSEEDLEQPETDLDIRILVDKELVNDKILQKVQDIIRENYDGEDDLDIFVDYKHIGEDDLVLIVSKKGSPVESYKL